MSQEKVEKYKEEKRNRKENLKKKAQQKILTNVITTVVILLVIGGVGYGFYNMASKNAGGTDANTVNVSSVTEYLGGLDSEIAMASFEEEETAETTEEAASVSDSATETE